MQHSSLFETIFEPMKTRAAAKTHGETFLVCVGRQLPKIINLSYCVTSPIKVAQPDQMRLSMPILLTAFIDYRHAYIMKSRYLVIQSPVSRR